MVVTYQQLHFSAFMEAIDMQYESLDVEYIVYCISLSAVAIQPDDGLCEGQNM